MLEKTFEFIKSYTQNNKTAVLPMYTLNNGAHQDNTAERFVIDGTAKELKSIQHPSKNTIETCTGAQFMDLVKRISLLWFFADYRRVKEHTSFKQIYGFAPRIVNYFDGNQVVAKLCDTYPCASCGIVMPISLTTVDHQKPQNGGELLAILKLLRVLGFTVDGPKGTKGQAFANFKTYNSLFYGIVNAQITATAMPHPQSKIVDSGKSARQTLTNAGALFYSACYHAKDMEDLKKIAMHSVTNLKPLCLRCNTSKGNMVLG